MKKIYLFSLMLLSFCAIGAKEVKSMVNKPLKRPYSSTHSNNKPVNKIVDMVKRPGKYTQNHSPRNRELLSPLIYDTTDLESNNSSNILNLNSIHYFENGKIVTSVSDPTSSKIIRVEVDPLTNKHSTIKLSKVENVIMEQTLDYDNYTVQDVVYNNPFMD